MDNVHETYEIHNKVQLTNMVLLDNAYVGNINIIPYEHYLKHNEESVVPSGGSHERNDEHVFLESSAYIPADSLTIKLNTYKDQVAIYEQRAKFELNERVQKMDVQMRILVQEHNAKEEKLKNELHYVQSKLYHITRHNKEILYTVNTLPPNFKQKENQFLNDFSRLKSLKNKLENNFYAQDQSIQNVHMMLRPRKLCDENSEKAIENPNPFRHRQAKHAQPALYNGNEIIKPDHIPVVIPTSDEENKQVELTRKHMT